MTGRTHVVTGSASGIGAATRRILEARGDRVIGVDLRDADIVCDLSDEAGRAALPDAVRALAPDGVDALHAVAGSALPNSTTVRVNYFGALATLTRLRPLLARSAAPRAVAVASFAALMDEDPGLADALRADDEQRATARAGALAGTDAEALIYTTTKRVLTEWVRRQAVSDDWARAGIPLNAVAPGIVLTPMTAPLMATPEAHAALLEQVPSPLGGAAEPDSVAHLLVWLTSPENRHVTGQVIFSDSGAEATVRGPKLFG
ncbi:SDR family oxidoreductase [Streptomyces roseirectus]|uniref:SDR family oxidoreductase n=1 Tax=Streptomyces roseirectus TaxID=2768066 RepID=A0A7H0I7F6_9ACTN|nr:SDR family oxidoreductase [Streptomyces roseirectus]QNP68722.1 SDR family oxidoreductase [Streptomyces roseirectus]